VENGKDQTIETIAIAVAQAPDIKVHSLNANGIRARLKQDVFSQYLSQESPDVLFIQEFRCTADKFFAKKDIKATLKELGYGTTIINTCQYNVGYAGTAIFSKLPVLQYEFLDNDKEGRFIAADFGKFIAANVYSPNSGRPGELAAMPKRKDFESRLRAKVLQLQKRKPTIVIGDLNVAPRRQDKHERWDPAYWRTHPSTTPQEIQMFYDLCTTTNLTDIQADLNITKFTYWRNKRHKQLGHGTRIDFVLAPKCWSKEDNCLRRFDIRQDINTGSDHAVLEFFLAATLFERPAPLQQHPTAPKIGPVAAMIEDVGHIEASCVAAATALTRLIDESDCMLFPNIEQQPDPTNVLHPLDQEEPNQVGPFDHILATTIADDEYGTVSWDQWLDLFDKDAVIQQHAVASTIEESSYAERNHECREEKHPYHMAPQPVILPSIPVTIAGRVTKTTRALGDTGASSSLIDRTFAAALLGEEELEQRMFRQGYQPTFRTADSRFTSPIGQLRLDFEINGHTFTHVFYVLDACAENIILGGCFFKATNARIDYRKGELLLEPDEGEPVPCSFEVHRPAGCALQTASALTSARSYTVPPDSSMVILAECPDRELDGQFGYVAQNTAEPRIVVPRSCTRLTDGVSKIIITNMSPNKFLRVDKGKQVAFFRKANRDDIDMYALDLKKLGTSEDAFIDLATMCEQRDATRAAHKPRTNKETNDMPTRPRECLLSCAPSCSSCNTTMLANANAAYAAASPVGTKKADSTVRDKGRNINNKKKRERDRNDSDHPEQSAGKCQRILLDATPTVLTTLSDEATSIDERFKHRAASDVDAIDLPRLTKEEVDAMSTDDLSAHFLLAPLKGIEISDHLDTEQRDKMQRFLIQNRDTFALNPKRPGQVKGAPMTINTGNATPRAFPHRSTMPHMRPLVEDHINSMLKYGIIRHSESPWGAAVLLVPKKTGETRIAIDLRLVNDCTEKFAWPMPRVDDALASLGGNSYFSALDMASGYWQVPIAEEDKHKTAFRCHMGQFEFNVMPFGVANGGAFFQRLMDTALGNLKFQCALCYIDDVLCYSPSFEQHVNIDLPRIMNNFREAGFHFKASKCSFAKPSVAYLGHVVSGAGVAPDPAKCASIKLAAPTTRAELRSFVGLCSYYRKFVKGFAKIVRPITSFLNTKIKLTSMPDDIIAAIDTLKSVLTSEPIICHPDFTKSFEIHCDAGPNGLGATLCQQIGGVERVVMFASRALRKHETNYHQYEKEALAVIWATAVFKPYVIGTRFKVITDNKAVTRLFTKQQNARIIRWVLALQEFDIEFVHRKGTKCGDVDGPSRIPLSEPVDYGKHVFAEALVLREVQHKHACCQSCTIDEALERGRCANCNARHACSCNSTPPRPAPDSCSTIEGRQWSQFATIFADNVQTKSKPHLACSVLEDGPTLPSIEEVKASQHNDPHLLRIINRLLPHSKNGTSITSVPYSTKSSAPEQFILRNGILLRKAKELERFAKRPSIGTPTVTQLCVPKQLRRAILYQCHGSPLAGHNGAKRTFTRLQQSFWWKGYEQDCSAWVRSCFLCQRRKTPQPKRQGLTGSLAAQSPLDTVGFDIVGPFAADKHGNKYVLTAVDHFTRFPIAVPMPNKEHATVAHALHRHLICVYGPPRRLLSDCEQSFVSEVTQGLLRLMGVKKINTSTYRPWSNGSCERMHRYLGAALTIYCDGHTNDWSDYLPSILFAYRTSFCAATGYSPFELLFGRKPNLPASIAYDLNPGQIKEEQKRNINVSTAMRDAYVFARDQQSKLAATNKRMRDANRRWVEFQKGDMVWKYEHTGDSTSGTKTPTTTKLRYRFSGPYVIQAQSNLGPNLYHITHVQNRATTMCNVDLLVPVKNDCEDIGLPIGLTEELHETMNSSHQLQPNDMVLLDKHPDNLDKTPFAVGRVMYSIGPTTFVVWWYGNPTGNIRGSYAPSWFSGSTNRRYYDDRRASHHEKHCSAVSATTLAPSNIIGSPFRLTNRGKIPRKTLVEASRDPKTVWSLPRRDIVVFDAIAAQ
jgi:exodeoxyribonuclease III